MQIGTMLSICIYRLRFEEVKRTKLDPARSSGVGKGVWDGAEAEALSFNNNIII